MCQCAGRVTFARELMVRSSSALGETHWRDAVKVVEPLLHSVYRKVELDVPNPSQSWACRSSTIIPQHGLNPMILLKLADQAIYRAKNSGRNQVAL